MEDNFQELFDYCSNELGAHPLLTQMYDIIKIAQKTNLDLIKDGVQETLEEAAERMYPINSTGGVMEMLNKHQLNNSYKQEGFIAGAKSDVTREYWYKKFWEDYESQFKNQEDEQ
jgi:hypothetical protein